MQRGAKPRYEPPEIAIERELYVWERRVSKRETYPEIAKSFEKRFGETISEAQISRILKKYREIDKGRIKDLVEQERVEQAALIDWAISQAVRGWKSSRKTRTKKIVTKENGIDPRSGNDYNKDITAEETEDQAGDPRFLKVILDASTRKSKLYGLDAAPKSATGEDEENPDPTGAKPWESLAQVILDSKLRIEQEATEDGES